jgi:hypothetical protein
MAQYNGKRGLANTFAESAFEQADKVAGQSYYKFGGVLFGVEVSPMVDEWCLSVWCERDGDIDSFKSQRRYAPNKESALAWRIGVLKECLLRLCEHDATCEDLMCRQVYGNSYAS